MLNRFDIIVQGEEDWDKQDRPDGDYVEYAEVAPLIKELEHLREEMQSLKEELGK